MEIPWQKLHPDTLRALIEEFVTRDGTDYGEVEAPFEAKIKQVHDLIHEGKVKLVFEPDTESCNLKETVQTK